MVDVALRNHVRHDVLFQALPDHLGQGTFGVLAGHARVELNHGHQLLDGVVILVDWRGHGVADDRQLAHVEVDFFQLDPVAVELDLEADPPLVEDDVPVKVADIPGPVALDSRFILEEGFLGLFRIVDVGLGD